MSSMGLAKHEVSKQERSQRLIFVLIYLYFNFSTAYLQDTNEDSLPALPEVIASFKVIKITPEKWVSFGFMC